MRPTLCSKCKKNYAVIFITKIESAPHSDAFFENLDASEDWQITDPGEELEEDGLRYRFITYERI